MGNVNRGKQFEEQVRKGFEQVENTLVTRLLDPMAGYAGVRNICDFIIYKYPIQLLIECKTHYGKSLPFSCVTDNQWRGMLAVSSTQGIHAGVLLWLVDCDATYFIPIETLEWMRIQGYKSISYKVLEEYVESDNGLAFRIPAIKKRILFEYDFRVFLSKVIDKHSTQ